MGKITQHDLLTAANSARHSAAVVEEKRKKEGVVPETPNLSRKLVAAVEEEHPFGHNENNRRVAERIAREGVVTKSQPVRMDPAEACKIALERHRKMTAESVEEPGKTADEKTDEDPKKAPVVPAQPPTWTPNA